MGIFCFESPAAAKQIKEIRWPPPPTLMTSTSQHGKKAASRRTLRSRSFSGLYHHFRLLWLLRDFVQQPHLLSRLSRLPSPTPILQHFRSAPTHPTTCHSTRTSKASITGATDLRSISGVQFGLLDDLSSGNAEELVRILWRDRRPAI
jgi:hypothetical protein